MKWIVVEWWSQLTGRKQRANDIEYSTQISAEKAKQQFQQLFPGRAFWVEEIAE